MPGAKSAAGRFRSRVKQPSVPSRSYNTLTESRAGNCPGFDLTDRGAQSATSSGGGVGAEALPYSVADPELQFRVRLGSIVGGGLEELVGQGQFGDRQERLHVLATQRARCVRQVVLVAQRLDPLADFGIAVARQVREQVMFDLVAQIAAHERHQRACVKIG